MKYIYILVAALVLTSCNDEEKENAYNAGLEDQRVHICRAVSDNDEAISVLREKRICR